MAARLPRPCWALVGSYAGYFTSIRASAADQEIRDALIPESQMWSFLLSPWETPADYPAHYSSQAELSIAEAVLGRSLHGPPDELPAMDRPAFVAMLSAVNTDREELVERILKQQWVNHWHFCQLLRWEPGCASNVFTHIRFMSRYAFGHRMDFRLLKPLRRAVRLLGRDTVYEELCELKPIYLAATLGALRIDPYQYATERLGFDPATAPISAVTKLFASYNNNSSDDPQIGGYLARVVAKRVLPAIEPPTNKGPLATDLWALGVAVFGCEVEHPNYHADWLRGLIGPHWIAELASSMFQPRLEPTWRCGYFKPTLCDVFCVDNITGRSFYNRAMDYGGTDAARRWIVSTIGSTAIDFILGDDSHEACAACSTQVHDSLEWVVVDSTPSDENSDYSEVLEWLLSLAAEHPSDAFDRITNPCLTEDCVVGMARHWFPYIDRITDREQRIALFKGALSDTDCASYYPFLDRIVAAIDPAAVKTAVIDVVGYRVTVAAAIWLMRRRFEFPRSMARTVCEQFATVRIAYDQLHDSDSENYSASGIYHFHPAAGTIEYCATSSLDEFDPDDFLSCLQQLRAACNQSDET